jgi:hypothetical protein
MAKRNFLFEKEIIDYFAKINNFAMEKATKSIINYSGRLGSTKKNRSNRAHFATTKSLHHESSFAAAAQPSHSLRDVRQTVDPSKSLIASDRALTVTVRNSEQESSEIRLREPSLTLRRTAKVGFESIKENNYENLISKEY